MAAMGFGIFDTYMDQRCHWVQTLVNHLWQDTPTGTMLKVALEDAQLEMGVTLRLTLKPSWKPDRWFTTNSWIKQCSEFLWEFEIHIEPLGTQLLPLRERDRALMDCFTIRMQDISTLRCLNRCRMAKQAVWFIIPLAIIVVIVTALMVIISAAVVTVLVARAPTLFFLEVHIKKAVMLSKVSVELLFPTSWKCLHQLVGMALNIMFLISWSLKAHGITSIKELILTISFLNLVGDLLTSLAIFCI